MQDSIAKITQQLNSIKVEPSDKIKISEDNSTLIYGIPSDDCALIFAYQDDTWVFQQKLLVSDRVASDWFGNSVSLSSDGNTALIGAYRASPKGTDSGAAYIFTRSGSTWTQQTKIFPGDGVSSDYFGTSVSLSSDGNTALVGAHGNSSYTGAAYIFTRSGSTWTQQQKLVPGDSATSDYFGYSVSISSDGGEIKIRNIHDKEYTFTMVDSVWTETIKSKGN